MLPEETINFLQRGRTDKFKKILEERKRGCGILIARKGVKILVRQELKKIKEKYKKRVLKINITRGLAAQAGIARGRVSVVENIHQLSKVKNKDILVAQQTTPGFVPIFKKVAGIVTDLGGITCHAAIISRELKIPCVIGTWIATKVLKDGDLVEVNTNHN